MKNFVIRAYGQFWGPDHCGYASLLCAGLYTEAEARQIAADRPNVDRAVSLLDAIAETYGTCASVNPEVLAAIARASEAAR